MNNEIENNEIRRLDHYRITGGSFKYAYNELRNDSTVLLCIGHTFLWVVCKKSLREQ